MNHAVSELDRRGLVCKPRKAVVQDPTDDILGLRWCGSRGYISVGHRRPWKIRLASLELLRRNSATSLEISRLTGHFTWCFMVWRGGLSLLNATYAFQRAFPVGRHRLWASVRREIFWAISLLPVLRANLRRQWCPEVTCTDASEQGYGVCTQRFDASLVGQVGRQAESWLYRTEGCVNARASALARAKHLDLDKIHRALAKAERKSNHAVAHNIDPLTLMSHFDAHTPCRHRFARTPPS